MRKTSLPTELISDLKSISDLQIFNMVPDRERFSRDFFDYSPVLRKKLEGCCADLVVRPNSVDAVLSVAGICSRYGIPLTLRGSGTGNYGQCVPLCAGIVMVMGALRQILEFNPFTETITVETGCLLDELDKVRLPYNINALSQASASFALAHKKLFDQQAGQIIEARGEVMEQLAAMDGVEVFSSDANFILFRVANASDLYSRLCEAGILIKNLDAHGTPLENCLRVTIGAKEENEQFLHQFCRLME